MVETSNVRGNSVTGVELGTKKSPRRIRNRANVVFVALLTNRAHKQ